MATEAEREAAAAAGPGSPEAIALEASDKVAADAAAAAEKNDKTPATDDKPAASPDAAKDDLTLDEAKPGDIDVNIPATGNKTIDDVATLLVDKKIPNADTYMKEFAETGELSLAAQAAMVEGLGEGVASLAIKQLSEESTRLKDKGTTERTEVLNYANEKFNGDNADNTWTELQTWVRSADSGITESDRAVMNDMIAKGGLQAKLAIDKIASLYYKDAANSSPADLLNGDTYTAAGFIPISRKEYTDQLRVAMRDHGEGSVQVNDLNRKRELSISRGY